MEFLVYKTREGEKKTWKRKTVKGYVVKVTSYNLKNRSNNVTFLGFVKKKKSTWLSECLVITCLQML